MSRPESLKGLTFEFVSDVLWSYSKEELHENLSGRTSTDLIGIIERILEDRDSLVHMVEQYSTRMKEYANKIGILENELSAVRATNLKEAQANSTRKKINESLAKRLEELDLKYRNEHANLAEQVERLEQQRQDHEVTISKLHEQLNSFTRMEPKTSENSTLNSTISNLRQSYYSKAAAYESLEKEKERCIESVTRQSVEIDRMKREMELKNAQISRDGNMIRQLHGQIENQKELIQRLKHQINERRPQQHSDHPLHHFMVGVSERDVAEVLRKEKTYKGSWMKRGGVGAYMMLARKWDRLESMATEKSYDIFAAINSNLSGDDGTALAEIRDLRRYLMLVESYINSQTCPTTQCPTVEQSAPIEDTGTTPPLELWQVAQITGRTSSESPNQSNVSKPIDQSDIVYQKTLEYLSSGGLDRVSDPKPQIQVLPNGFEVRSVQSVPASDPGIKPENPDDSNPYLVQELRRSPGELESGKGANVPAPTCVYKFDPVTNTWNHVCDIGVSTGDTLYLRSVSSPKKIMVTIEGVQEQQEDVKQPIGFTDKQ